MKNKIKKLLSILVISAVTLIDFGVAVSATGGTGDARLSGLEVSPGTLSPEFSSDCYEYYVEVGEDCDKLLVNTQTVDSGAKAVIAGNSSLKAGVNSVIINVTAADGTTTARYTIQVTRGAAQAGDSSAAQGGQTSASGSQLGGGIASNPLIMGNRPASGSSETEALEETTSGGEDDETEAPLASEEDLEDGQVPGGGELPEGEGPDREDPETAGQAAGVIVTAGKTYTLAVPDEAMVPNDFEAATVSIGGQPVSVWQFPSNYEVAGLYLIYGTSPEGKTAFYIYDESEGTVITAAEGLLSIGQEGKISQNQLRSTQETYQKSLKSRMIIIICLSVLCFILVILLTASLTRRKRQDVEAYGTDYGAYHRKSGPEEEEEDFYGDDGGPEEDEEDFYQEEDYGELYEDEEEAYGADGCAEENYGEEDYEEEDYGVEYCDEEDYDDAEAQREGGGELDSGKDAAPEGDFLYYEDELPEEKEEYLEPEIDQTVFQEVQEEQKKKRLTEPEPDERETEGDTAPLPNLVDTGRLEPVKAVTAEVLAETEDFGLEDIDLELFDLEEGKETGPEAEMRKETGNSRAEVSEEVPVKEPEAVDAAKPQEAEPEAGSVEEPEADSNEELEPETIGFEEITLEDVGFGEIKPAGEVWGEEYSEEKEEYSDEKAHLNEREDDLDESEGHPDGNDDLDGKTEYSDEREEYSDEEEWFPLPDEEEEVDVDAEFDLLDALLSDSLRDGKPTGRK